MTIMIDDRQALYSTHELQRLVELSVDTAIKMEGIKSEYQISIIFVDNEQIKEINREYREIDRATDVLSFPMLEYDETEGLGDNDRNVEDGNMDVDMDTGELVLGDIAISLERAGQQAEEYGHSLEREVAFLTVHGTLHLLGYDHEVDKDRVIMREREEKILEALNLPR